RVVVSAVSGRRPAPPPTPPWSTLPPPLTSPQRDPPATSNPHSTTTSLRRHAFTPVSQHTRSRARPYPTSGSQVSTSHSSPSILQSQARALPGIPSHVLAASQVTSLPSPISGRTR
ncbi:unnamed protein product, partial [Meganyctiphanes norvegica]